MDQRKTLPAEVVNILRDLERLRDAVAKVEGSDSVNAAAGAMVEHVRTAQRAVRSGDHAPAIVRLGSIKRLAEKRDLQAIAAFAEVIRSQLVHSAAEARALAPPDCGDPSDPSDPNDPSDEMVDVEWDNADRCDGEDSATDWESATNPGRDPCDGDPSR